MPPPRPHPLARSRLSERLSAAVEWIWDKGLTPKPPLQPEYLWQVGAKGFDRQDEISIRAPEDVADFRQRLDVLCRSLREEADLNPIGHTMAYGQIVAAIRNRHALGRLWRERPELAAAPIAPPIVVVGQMRAGTTRVHRLLAADPRHAGTRFCDSHNPVPRTPDWRPLKSRAALAIARRINPWLETLHPFGATRTDEEIGWLAAGLSACTFEAQYRVPGFVAFNEALDPQPLYNEFARILRTDAAIARNAERPRVMKCPQFSEDLPALLSQFPDARLVVTQRDRSDVLDSAVSMVAAQTAFQTDSAQVSEIESEWRRKLTLRETRLQQALQQFDGRVGEVGFAELNHDWREAIGRIYKALGIELGANALTAMATEQAHARGTHHGAHRETLQGFADA